LDWLKAQMEMLEDKKDALEVALGISTSSGLTGILLSKARAGADPSDDGAPADDETLEAFQSLVGSGSS
jgi:hypothetical protein